MLPDSIFGLFTGGGLGIPQWFASQGGAVLHSIFNGVTTIEEAWTAVGELPQEAWQRLWDVSTNIPDIFATAAFGIWSGIAFFLPDGGTFPDQVHEAAIYFGGSLASVDPFLPTQDLIAVILLSASVYIALTLWTIGYNIFKIVRGV